ncbi:MAG TPA: hypothetical protein VHH72_02935 [Solirubrobacterales bacterium]|jgi:hypothetical protein|nr:hypothetical protein [Solirubrobacterales bacterium]
MGLMDAFKRMRMKDPIDVDARVVSVSEPPHATHGTAVEREKARILGS